MHDEPEAATTVELPPWPEARPPHLPDALTSLSPWVIGFLLLAGLQVFAGWREWVAEGDLRDGSTIAFIIQARLPGVCVALLAAALFSRHPDAHRRLPMLTFGVVLLNVAPLMGLATNALNTVFVAAAEAGDEGSSVVTVGIYGGAIIVLVSFGVVFLARGLAMTRRGADVVSGRVLGIAMIALVAVGSVLSLIPFFSQPDTASLLSPFNVVFFVLAKLNNLAWAYLFVIAFGGWLAGEQPRIGWLLAALAAGLDVALLLLLGLAGLVDIARAGQAVLEIIGWLGVANWVLLLLAFAVGLPSVAMAVDDPEVSVTADSLEATRSGSGAG